MATLTLNGLLTYDPTILESFKVPTLADLDPSLEIRSNAPTLSRQTAIDWIVFQTLGLSLVYTAPDDMREAVRVWVSVNMPAWIQLYQTMVLRYNPIWNKDGTITETHKGSYDRENSGTGTHSVTGYDSNAMSPSTRDDGSGTDKGSDEWTDKRIEQGNIGVTSTQALIREQREIAGFSLYDYIADSFKHTFCVCIY